MSTHECLITSDEDDEDLEHTTHSLQFSSDEDDEDLEHTTSLLQFSSDEDDDSEDFEYQNSALDDENTVSKPANTTDPSRNKAQRSEQPFNTAGSNKPSCSNKRPSDTQDPPKKRSPVKNRPPVIPIENPVDACAESIFNFRQDDVCLTSHGQRYLQIERNMCESLPDEYQDPVFLFYNPLVHAFDPHRNFIARYCNSAKDVLFLGMNPGPYGMSQNGVPFGDTTMVTDWLQIDGHVNKPRREHPAKPVHGLSCTRKEGSGRRFWGVMRKLFNLPETFFEHCFVHNYCPLQFMQNSGKNVTFDKLCRPDRDRVYAACDKALREVVDLLQAKIVIGVGAIAEKRANEALADHVSEGRISIQRIDHPSPGSPLANKAPGWEVNTEPRLRTYLAEFIPSPALSVQSKDP